MEKETQKYYLGRPVIVVGETHPSKTVTVRYENGEEESVQKHQVTDKSPADVAKAADEKAKADKVVADKAAPKTAKPSEPVKEWFKK